MDISSFMNWFIGIFINIVQFFYKTLDNIKFNGISLLQYTISLSILYAILTLLFTLVSNREVYEKKEKRIEKQVDKKRKEQSNNND